MPDQMPNAISREALAEALARLGRSGASQTWVRDAEVEPAEPGELRLSFSNAFFMDYVRQRHQDDLRAAAADLTGGVEHRIRLSVREPKPAEAAPRVPTGMPREAPFPLPEAAPVRRGRELHPAHRFQHFEVDEANRLAFAASEAIAQRDFQLSGQTLVLCGGVGLGKTHLLQAAVSEHEARTGSRGTGRYFSAESFLNEFLRALETKSVDRFRATVRGLKLIAIDDIQYLVGKDKTQSELIHTVDAIVGSGGAVIISADRPVGRLQGLDERLRSRFECAMKAVLEVPSEPARRGIVRRRAALLGFQLADEVVALIAAHGAPTPREIAGHVTQIVGSAALDGGPIDLARASLAMERSGRSKPRQITFQTLLREVASSYQVAPEELVGKSRVRRLAFARHVLTYLAREHLHLPLQEIGRQLSGRDHSTVLYGYERIREALKADHDLASTLDAIAAAARRA